MDPLLFDPFENGINRFEPPVRIDPPQVARGCDLLLLSHQHMDHFCLRSLAQVDRRCTVLYPQGCTLIEAALRALGFSRRQAVAPGGCWSRGELQLHFTASAVGFPEMGVLFLCGGHSVWNMVDTLPAAATLAQVRQLAPRLDLLLANYQVLVEEELGRDALGAAFPLHRYAQRLEAVRAVQPRWVVPGACGYAYAHQPWMNERGFAVEESEFLRDLAALAPPLRGLTLPPGGQIELDDSAPDGLARLASPLPGVEALPACPTVRTWRPDRGVPPLRDDDPFGHGASWLRDFCPALLATQLLPALHAARGQDWFERLAGGEVLWELELVYPDGTRRSHWLDFAQAPLRWLPAAPRPPKLVTSLCASTLAGLHRGEANGYRALFTRRVAGRLYRIGAQGVEGSATYADEPIARLLMAGADRRYLAAELRRLGHVLPDGAVLGPTLRPAAHGRRLLPRRGAAMAA